MVVPPQESSLDSERVERGRDTGLTNGQSVSVEGSVGECWRVGALDSQGVSQCRLAGPRACVVGQRKRSQLSGRRELGGLKYFFFQLGWAMRLGARHAWPHGQELPRLSDCEAHRRGPANENLHPMRQPTISLRPVRPNFQPLSAPTGWFCTMSYSALDVLTGQATLAARYGRAYGPIMKGGSTTPAFDHASAPNVWPSPRGGFQWLQVSFEVRPFSSWRACSRMAGNSDASQQL